MLYGAIDIGSNAVRLLIASVLDREGKRIVKKLSLTRIPLRLGEGVFDNGEISKKKAEELVKTIKAFKLILELYKVKDFSAAATSAMREAKNGKSIIKKILKETGISIKLISGEEEAKLICTTFYTQDFDYNQAYLFIDVGGGSTEFTMIKKGKFLDSKSFKIGTVRMLKGKAKKEEWDRLKKWVNKINVDKYMAIGTGGNINTIAKILGRKYTQSITIQEFKEIDKELNKLSYKERLINFQLKPDRADVIIPASKIYITAMEWAGIKEIYIPKMGLTDGMILSLSEN